MSTTDSGKNVLLLHGGALGDFVLAYRFAQRFAGNASDELRVVARHPIVRWFAERGLLKRGLTDGQVELFGLFSESALATDQLSEILGACDLVINMIADDHSVLHDNLKRLCVGEVRSFSPKPDDSNGHIIDQWMVRSGVKPVRDAPVSPLVDDSVRSEAGALLRERYGLGVEPVFVIHPGSGGRSKCAPVDCFVSLRSRAVSEGWSVVWMIGPDEAERDGELWDEMLPSEDQVLCEPSVGRAADMLAGADGFCGNDAGMTHLAAAMGIPTVAWFGPTPVDVWMPVGRRVVAFDFPSFSAAEIAERSFDFVSKADCSDF